MGFVDRGGAREAKGTSLRRSKKNPGAPASKKASFAKQQQQNSARVPPTPPPFAEGRQSIDAAVAILSRKLEADRDVLMKRAAEESGVAAALTWCGEFDRQEALVQLCRQHNTSVSAGSASDEGMLYCLVGVHANNVDRMHKKLLEGWVESISSWGKNPEVLGVLSGLNFDRDSGTHFAQEWLLEQLWSVAGFLQVPLVLHICYDAFPGKRSADAAVCNSAVNRAADLISDLISRQTQTDQENDDAKLGKKNPTAIVLYNGLGAVSSSSSMRALVKRHAPSAKLPSSAGDEKVTATTATADVSGESAVASAPPIYILLTAEGLTQSSNGANCPTNEDNEMNNITVSYNPLLVNTLRENVSLSQILIGTGSPWNTPQNIPDEHMRSMPNEPANYRYVVAAVFDALTDRSHEKMSGMKLFYRTVCENFIRVFFNSETTTQVKAKEQCDEPNVPHEVENETTKNGKKGQVGEVHFDPSIKTLTDAVPVAPNSVRYYLCLKCRRRLFQEHCVLTHPPDLAQAHFGGRHARSKGKYDKSSTAAMDGSCESVCFLPVVDGQRGEWTVKESGVDVNRLNGTVSCGGCRAKIGTAGDNICCPCGCIISRLTARIAASKVEAPMRGEVAGDLDELLAQAARERDQLLQEELEEAARQSDAEGDEWKKKNLKKNVKANNRSNFTHFRNKNFAPRHQPVSGNATGPEKETKNNYRTDEDKHEEEEDNDGEGEEVTMRQTGRRKNRRRRAEKGGD